MHAGQVAQQWHQQLAVRFANLRAADHVRLRERADGDVQHRVGLSGRVRQILEGVLAIRETHCGTQLAGWQIEEAALCRGFIDVLRDARAIRVSGGDGVDAVLRHLEVREDRQTARAVDRRRGDAGRRQAPAVIRRLRHALEAAGRREADVVEIGARRAVRGIGLVRPVAQTQVAAEAGQDLIQVGRVLDRTRRQEIQRAAEHPRRIRHP